MIDPHAVAMYRKFLWDNSDTLKPLPESLLEIHEWAYKKAHQHCLRSRLDEMAMLNVVLIWERTTADGQRFLKESRIAQPIVIPIMDRPAPKNEAIVLAADVMVDWFKVKKRTPVVATNSKTGEVHDGEFMSIRKNGKILVQIFQGSVKYYRTYLRSSVALAKTA